MTDNMIKFYELISQNKEIGKELSEASKENIISVAKKHGIELSDADFEPTELISDDELEVVAGGKDCACFMGGGGTGDDGVNKTCACVGYGLGEYTHVDFQRCGCFGIGGGVDYY